VPQTSFWVVGTPAARIPRPVDQSAARDNQQRRRREGDRDIEARDRDLQRLARTDLLNLHRDFDYWNPPEPAGPGESEEDGEPQ
jgi:hypothetical protein